MKVPVTIAINRGQIDATRQEKSRYCSYFLERVLEAIDNRADESGAKLCFKKIVGKAHGSAQFNATCIFKHLNLYFVAHDFNDFAFEAHTSDFYHHHFALAYITFKANLQQVAKCFYYLACSVLFCLFECLCHKLFCYPSATRSTTCNPFF